MNETRLKGNPVHLKGHILEVGSQAPDFTYVREDLTEGKLSAHTGKKKVIIALPSIETGVCQAETRRFSKELSGHKDVIGIVVSKDLPFALKRFCAAEGIDNIEVASDFRGTFTNDYNTRMEDGIFKGLSARVVFVLDQNNKITFTELVDDISHEPDYDKVMAEVKKA